MTEYYAALLTAFWLGIMTSISPCPLATNIAAISFISKELGTPRRTFQAGLFYTCGRALAYLLVGLLLVNSLLSAPLLSHLLQKYMNKLLGPLLFVTGLLLLEIFRLNFSFGRFGERLHSRVRRLGLWGGALLGFVFALSFCPTSAALFFGALLPLALQQNSAALLPVVYGVATALPVMFFALLFAFGAHRIGAAFSRITQFEKWARRITGIIFLLVGIYYTLVNIFAINI
ncbi:MAG TPA: sulfite exporter TauE/SafE family protein [Proteobacteria bacterium]|nr:sulfite exporter TauE/SafE family protein [Pseudomonadota bacterium]